MGRKKENPVNMAAEDVNDTLCRASEDLVEAQEALEAARAPVKKAKAAVKACGIDHDIFRLFHGIRHLEEDAARQRRLRMVQVAMDALLSDRVTPDLFGPSVAASVAPAAKQALKEASDELHEVEPPDTPLPFDVEPQGEQADASASEPAAETVEQEAANQPVETAATAPEADWGEDGADGNEELDAAGFTYAAGRTAGRKGATADENPHAPKSPAYSVWERGRLKGVEEGDIEDEPLPDVLTEEPPKRSRRRRSADGDTAAAIH